MKKKNVLSLVAIILIPGVLLGINRFDSPEHLQPSKIVGLPENYTPYPVYKPYNGPHPSAITRPDETFKFPVKLGEVGPVQHLFAGELEYPYLCQVEESGLGQPLVDNQDGIGIKVFKVNSEGIKTPEVIGYSKDCSIPSQANYMYVSTKDGRFYPLEKADNDIQIISKDGREIEFIVRVEVGTINRHLYMIYVLRGENEKLESPDPGNWNKKLIYQFKGGVGIGKRQGKLNITKLLNRRKSQLEQGYALVHSTANQTSIHYDIWLSEDSALRVKKQFTSLYGEPEYTVGLGGSGGAIQQYLLAQNKPGIIDAALAIYSYPDMLSQTTYVLDCELLEYFFDVVDVDNSQWSNWENRSLLEGMNAKNDWFNRYTVANAVADILSFKWPNLSMGMTECVNSWRGLTPLILNPHFPVFPQRLSENIRSKIKLNYWDNMKTFYGTDDEGNARVTWDNVGVQYGLDALKKSQISIETFLKLNASIGGWKKPADMAKEHFWYFSDELLPGKFSVWSHHNATIKKEVGSEPAKRHEGDVDAIKAAYKSGQIFLGKIDIPVIDLRHYLDDELDMHHSFATFSARSRMIREQGHADNQVIWMARKPHVPIDESLQLVEHWMLNIKNNPHKSVVENRPANATDKCTDSEGNLIAEGKGVWDGEWNNRATGICMEKYPSYKTSRMQAGDDIAGDVFKCHLQAIDEAIKSGLYGSVEMSRYQSELETIFPDGVCDYTKLDSARPDDLIFN